MVNIMKTLILCMLLLLSLDSVAGRYDGLADVFNRAAKNVEELPTRKLDYDTPNLGGNSIGVEPPKTNAIPYNEQWNVKPITPAPKYDGSSVSKTFNYNSK
jgi:hypothetical protein